MIRLFAIVLFMLFLRVPAAAAGECDCPEPTVEESERLLESGVVIADAEVFDSSGPGDFIKMVRFYNPPINDVSPKIFIPLDKEKSACIKKGDVRDFVLSCSPQISSSTYSCKIENICSRLHPTVKAKTNSVDAKTYLIKMCKDKKGKYEGEVNSMCEYLGCNLPSEDAGKKCLSSKDCKGACLAKTDNRGANGFIQKYFGSETGTCQPYQTIWDSYITVENGRVSGSKTLRCHQFNAYWQSMRSEWFQP